MNNNNSIDNNSEQETEDFGGKLSSDNAEVESNPTVTNPYTDVPVTQNDTLQETDKVSIKKDESDNIAEEHSNVVHTDESISSYTQSTSNSKDNTPPINENIPPRSQSSYGVYTQYRGEPEKQPGNTQPIGDSQRYTQQNVQQPTYQNTFYQQQGAGYMNNFANTPQGYGNTSNFNQPPQQGYGNSANFNQPLQQGYGNPANFSHPPQQGYGNPANFNQPPQQGYGNPYEANPYQQSTNQQMNQMPQIQYMPYTPGTILPEGVTPQIINGGWYYPYVVLPNQKNAKKKMATSVKVLLGIIAGITVAFIVLLFVWSFNINKDNNFGGDSGSNFFFEFEEPDDNSSDYSSGEVGKYADPNGPEISLVDSNTSNGSTEKAYEVLSDSVVSVSTYDDNESPSTSSPNGEGTGIIISEDGYIVTNSHVIDDKNEGNVWITTKDGDVYSVVIVGCDVRTDIAVLKCDKAEGWKSATFANSEQLKVGQDVVALGSPGGSSYSNSLTRGIISALNRTLSGSAVTYIQTDAAINPGNSGGPLANMNGQVIGINTIKVVDTQYEGMGFAIPSVTIKEVADQLIKNGYVKGRARIGIVGREVSRSMAQLTGGEAGIYINEIEDDSPLKDTEVKVGDTITAINGTNITTFNELFNTLDTYNIGDTITMTICRTSDKSSDNETFTVTITLVGE